MNKKLFLISALLPWIAISVRGAEFLDVCSGRESHKGKFSLIGRPIIYDDSDFPVVKKAVEMLGEDLEKVTGVHPEIKIAYKKSSDNSILVGTIGHSKAIDALVKSGMISVKDIKGQPERFKILTISDKKGHNTLVIVGSDRRGTAYGVTTLARAIGVDPWVWWADVPVERRPDISVTADFTSNPPSIKYRGIFINDEDWGMLPWAASGLDKDLNDIGPNTYEKVCQLLLRLKGNMLAPAMHSCTGAFYSIADNKKVADEYGIIITTSHCEPMLFNNAAKSEWDSERDGVWDYGLNRDVIYKKFSDRLDEASEYENIYTIGMRGVHDEAMSRERPVEEKIKLLEEVITDQRELLSKRFGKPANEIPQIFVPYKETLDLYRKGLNVPDDVTIIWPDDNYGYMKSLSSPDERKRSGGSGVYYHISYLGTPHDYLWLCTTPPAFMYGELRKAYDHGADRYWLLNVGDIKPGELATQTFFDLAWNIEDFDEKSSNTHQASMLAKWCGQKYEKEFQWILDEYYRLAWIRKPEYMGWEIEWDSPEARDIRPTEFSFSNYGDAVKRIDDYLLLSQRVQSLMASLPDSLRPPVFQTIGYPAIASHLMNRKFLFAQLNKEYAEAGNKERANYAAFASSIAADQLDSLTNKYNRLNGGKWSGMMTIPPGFVAKYQNRPALIQYPGLGSKAVYLTWDASKSACTTLDLGNVVIDENAHKAGVALIDGYGYDGKVLRLGNPKLDYGDNCQACANIDIDYPDKETLNLMIFHLPYFPLHDGKGCRIGVSVDDGEEQIIEYLPEEWSRQWKDNILRNSALSRLTFPVDSSKNRHRITMRGLDPGMTIQRIIIDEGGFNPGYVGYDIH